MTDLNPKIVVVDDEPAIGELLVNFLGQEGYEITSFTSGKKALAHLKTKPVDLLLTDLRMPEMNGLDVIKATKKTKPDLPIMAMSGSPDSEMIEIIDELRKLGVSNYLKKPFTLNYLKQVIVQTLSPIFNNRFSQK